MSTILGIFGDDDLTPEQLAGICSSMGTTPGEESIWRGNGALLAAWAPGWQKSDLATDGGLVASIEGIAVAADASLYYRNDLRRALQASGVGAREESRAAELIAAAYRAWGRECVHRLEGDWAFIIWDERDRKVVCARDFGARRQLHYSGSGSFFMAASTIGGVLAHRRTTTDLNLVSIAESLSGFLASSHETCYRSVSRLMPGHTLQWKAGRISVDRHWNPDPREDPDGPAFDEAAVHLNSLLQASVGERLSASRPTSIQLSGGWDSTAVFGAGMELLRLDGSNRSLMPVSISYPPGDPGREDEIIEMILARWNASTRWIPIDEIPLFDQPLGRAADRDEPFSHLYEFWNRRLARECAGLGSTVMLDGFGGDSLFQTSLSYFADLLRKGRLRELRREWKSKGLKGFKDAGKWVVQPLIPRSLLHLISDYLAPNGLEIHLERSLPDWLDPAFRKRHRLLHRERSNTPQSPGGPALRSELYWQLTSPWVGRMLAENYRLGMEEGVETRSPLFDRRIVEFAMTRPQNEFSFRRETKRLLRRSMKGLLPDDVLGPRRYRTGMTSGFLHRQMRLELPGLRDEFLGKPLLAEYGLVDAAALNRAVDGYLSRGDGSPVQLLLTVNAELWLRAHSDSKD